MLPQSVVPAQHQLIGKTIWFLYEGSWGFIPRQWMQAVIISERIYCGRREFLLQPCKLNRPMWVAANEVADHQPTTAAKPSVEL